MTAILVPGKIFCRWLTTERFIEQETDTKETESISKQTHLVIFMAPPQHPFYGAFEKHLSV